MRLEAKPAPSIAESLAYPLGAVAVTLVIVSLLVLAAGAQPFSVFQLVLSGRCGIAIRRAGDADPRHAADLHGARRGGRLSCQAVEHRRRGAALCRGGRHRRAGCRRPCPCRR